MFRTVELPLWLLVLILLFAAVTFASHFLFPSVRWFFRRRMERVVAQINQRLERPIQPFKLARRYDMIQRLIYDPKVAEAIAEHVKETGVPENVAFEAARRYAREIVPSFSATAYFTIAIRLARWLSRWLYRVHLDESNDAALKAIDGDATVIFVMNHRSNMDYVLVTYLVAERSALSYAVGEWARVWPMSGLIRAMGAYFIRRKSRNALYRRVLARYVQLATRGGVAQAFFPEGGLSLDGAVGPPKLGLLSYVLADFDPDAGRDVVFVPVALNYDRVLEDRVLTSAARDGRRRFRASISQALGFSFAYVFRRVTGRAKRFGVAGVSYGAPLSLTQFLAGRPKSGRKNDGIKAVGLELRKRIKATVPVLPVPLVAYVLEMADGPVPRAELVRRVDQLLRQRTLALIETAPDVVEDAVFALLEREIIVEGPEGINGDADQKVLLAYYARSISHLL